MSRLHFHTAFKRILVTFFQLFHTTTRYSFFLEDRFSFCNFYRYLTEQSWKDISEKSSKSREFCISKNFARSSFGEQTWFFEYSDEREIYKLCRASCTRVYGYADEWGMLYAFFQPAFLYRIIARLALHPCRVTHMPYRPVKELRRAIDDPEQATLSPQEYLVSSTHSMQQHLMILCNTLRTSSN